MSWTYFVDADSSKMRKLFEALKHEYEKCNFWPMYVDEQELMHVLLEERRELQEAYDEWKATKYAYESDGTGTPLKIDKDTDKRRREMLRGHTVKIMLEAIQVIAVLDKWEERI